MSRNADLAKEALKQGAMQKVHELTQLLDFLTPYRLRRVMEIGTARGGTLYAWCKIAEPTATIVSVDLPGGIFGGGYTFQDVERFRTFAQPNQALHFLRQDSHSVATKQQVEEIFSGVLIDFLFIDGDHFYAGVKQDWEWYTPLVRKGGIIALHDTLPDFDMPSCEVHRFWQKIRSIYQVYEFVDPDDNGERSQWGGIGVVVKE